jgi:hypothetical protein
MNYFIGLRNGRTQLSQPLGPQPGMAQLPPAFSAVGDESDEDPGAESPAEDVPLESELLDEDDAFLPPSRKSVTYQPPPLRINPVRDMSLTRGPPWHEGHSVGWGSDSFCMTS